MPGPPPYHFASAQRPPSCIQVSSSVRDVEHLGVLMEAKLILEKLAGRVIITTKCQLKRLKEKEKARRSCRL